MPTTTTRTAVRMLVRIGTWDTAGAVALALAVLAFGEKAWFPSDELVVVAVLLGGIGLPCLAVGSFLGPAPFWADGGRARDGWAAVALLGVPAVVVYAWISVPLLHDGVEWSWTLFGIAVACGAASIRASSVAAAGALGCFAGGFLWLAAPTFGMVWLHCFLTLGLIALTVTAFRTGSDRTRVLSILAVVLGIFLWLYSGLVVLVFVRCDTGGACILA